MSPGDGAKVSERPGIWWLSWAAFLYGIMSGGAIIGLFLIVREASRPWNELYHLELKMACADWLIVTMVLNLAISALIQWYAEKRAYGAHYRQYRRMRTTFLAAYDGIAKRNRPVP
jgi:hypothetical protein